MQAIDLAALADLHRKCGAGDQIVVPAHWFEHLESNEVLTFRGVVLLPRQDAEHAYISKGV